jgi:hypothetical protein
MKATRGNYYSSFDPRSLPQCVLWLDADDSNAFTFTSGSNIAFWRDKSPIQNDVCASGVPVRQQNVWNNKPGVFFNGTSFLGRSIAENTSNELTGFVVADISSSAIASGRIVSLGTAGTVDSNASRRTALFHRSTTTAAVATTRNSVLLSFVNISYGIPFIACSTFTGTSNRMFGNSTSLGQTASSGNFGYTTLGIGRNNGSSTPTHVGYIYEVLLYNYELTSNERQTVEGYLAYKWGHQSNLPANHPYKATQPFNRPFIPPDLANCLVWLDAANMPSLDLSAAGVPTIINTWRDRSGFSNTFIPTTVNNLAYEGPSYLSNAQAFFSNNNNGARVAGNDGLCNATTILGVGPNFGLYHIGCNTRALTADFNDAIQIRRLENGTLIEYHMDVTGSNGPFSSTSVGGTRAVGVRVSSCNANVVYGSFFGSNYVDCRRNGHPFLGLRGSLQNGTPRDINYFTIGGHTDNRQYTGSINELILYNNIDASYAYNPRIEQYLARKFDTWTDLSVNNPYRRFPALSIAFNPVAVGYTDAFSTTVGCRLWLDAMDSNSFVFHSGSSVRQVRVWLDKSGNNRHASNGTLNNSPVYNDFTNPQFPYVDFNPTFFNQFLNLSDATSFAVNQNWSMFVVEQRATSRATNALFGGSAFTTNSNLTVGYTTDTQFTMNFYNNPVTATVPTFANDSRVRVWSLIKNPGGKRIFENGRLAAFDVTATNLISWEGAAIGGGTGSGNYYLGRIFEILWYTNLPSNEQRQVEGYLAHKWNRDGSLNDFHPYKLTVP